MLVRAGAIALVCIAVPWILPVLVPLLLSFLWVRARYLATSREVKRFDAVTRSPVYAAFSATLKVELLGYNLVSKVTSG